MKIKDFTVRYVSHCSFLFYSPKSVILTDPLFAESFPWHGHIETHVTTPRIPLKEITQCDGIFVSHIHGDHYDPEAISDIHRRTKAPVLAPDDVLDSLRNHGISEKYLVRIAEGAETKIKDVRLTALSGYDNAFDKKGRPNKFSAVMKTGNASIFYSGDCHEIPPGLKGKRVDAIIFWPRSDDERLLRFCTNVDFSTFVLMHGDRFEPGDFLCNLDYSKERIRIQRLLPNAEVVIPE